MQSQNKSDIIPKEAENYTCLALKLVQLKFLLNFNLQLNFNIVPL
jgi:hypothetical protein